RIDVIDVASEEYAQEMLGFSNNSSGGNPTSTSEPIISDSSHSLTPFEGSDFILEEIEAYLNDESILPKIDHADCDLEGDIYLIENLLNDDPFQLPLMDLKQGEVAKAKSSIEEPSELDSWVSHIHCVPKKVGITVVENETMSLFLHDWSQCMRTRNSYFPNNSSVTIPRRRNKRRAPNVVEPELRTIIKVAPMADNRTMEELLQALTKGYGEAIVIPEINADHFEIKKNLLQLVQANLYHGFERENPHTHINNFKRITSTLKFRDVPNDVIKLMMFPYLLEGAARVWMNTTSRENASKMDDRIDKLADQISTLVDIFAKKVVAPATVKAVEES
nr:reverse transcriptase domain-containing protein [Tanacetum cinerariifolium]